DQGKGWTYTPRDRHVTMGVDGTTAWFDEKLDNAKYGECRGSGVLVREAGAWRIAQYNLTVPVPNDMLADVAKQIREYKKPE
ncbi:MAG: nuclear transport factor 2 family protein, partial [Phycisphaerales bacterium]